MVDKPEYITKDEVISVLTRYGMTEDGEAVIRNIPSTDVAPVKHGKWMLEYEPNGKPYCFHCSVCDGDFHYIDVKIKYDFCPHCGAKMDG